MKVQRIIKTLFLCGSIFLYNCTDIEENTPNDIKLNKFVWGGMNAYYKWQKKIPNLADDKFIDEKELNDYLKKFNNPQELFDVLRINEVRKIDNKLLKEDKTSKIIDDYHILEKEKEDKYFGTGIVYKTKSVGDKIYATITNVIPGSDADKQGIRRGFTFDKVDDTQLTTSNIKTIFDKNSYTITLFNSTTKYTLTKTEIIETPIKMYKTFDYNEYKIGYLFYDKFSPNFDKELNSVFKDFKDFGVNKLIIDLRDNKGKGSLKTASYLASMITGQLKNKVFCKEVWNEKVMKNNDAEKFIYRFTDEIQHDDFTEKINTLNLRKVYFITTEKTESIAETLINGLKAHIIVKLIGRKTAGKEFGYITLYDSDDYTKGGYNLDNSHTKALKLIAFETKNAKNYSSSNGYVQNSLIRKKDESKILKNLGNIQEDFLAKTLFYISGGK